MNVKISLNIAIVCITVLLLSVITSITWIAVVHDGNVAVMVVVALVSVVSAFASGLSGLGQAIVHAMGGKPAPVPTPAPAPDVTVTP